MIPSIETIIEDLLAGSITKQQAITWLHMHAEDAGRDLRDAFAMAALTGELASTSTVASASACAEAAAAQGVPVEAHIARCCYEMADAMLAERSKA